MGRGRLLIIVALILIILSIGGIFLVLQLTAPPPATPTPEGGATQAASETEAPATTVQIVRAIQPIERGALITAEAVDLVPWPADIADPALVITDINQVIGSRARYSLQPGQPIFTTMVVQTLPQISPFGSDTAARIPAGFTAISIPYDQRNGVALGIRDGDYVNVIVSWALVDIDLEFQTILPNLTAAVAPPESTFTSDPTTTSLTGILTGVVVGQGPQSSAVGRAETDPILNIPLYLVPQEAQRPRLVTQTIIQYALVMHVGEFKDEGPTILQPTAPPPPPAEPNATPTPLPPPTPTPPPPDIITLAVSPQDALVLDYVNRMMERYPDAVNLTFTLRSADPLDQKLSQTQSVTLQYIFDTYGISLPAKLPYGLDRTVIPTPVPATP
jgi:pilus assembly protein CpaB